MRAVIAVAAPFVAMLAAHLAVNQYKWGRWLGSPMAAEAFIREPILAGLQGFLLSPGVSIFVYSPLLLLLPWTALAASRSHRLELVATVVVFCSYLFFFAGFSQWTGLWSAPGPRYMLVPCVLLMLPLGIWLDRGPHLIGRIALVSLAALGGLIQLPLLTADWLATVFLAGYESYDPPFSFVFIPEASPILKMTTTALDGYVNLWLHKLARGWPGQPGQPEIALALLIAGVLGCMWLGTVIVAQLRRTSTQTE